MTWGTPEEVRTHGFSRAGLPRGGQPRKTAGRDASLCGDFLPRPRPPRHSRHRLQATRDLQQRNELPNNKELRRLPSSFILRRHTKITASPTEEKRSGVRKETNDTVANRFRVTKPRARTIVPPQAASGKERKPANANQHGTKEDAKPSQGDQSCPGTQQESRANT